MSGDLEPRAEPESPLGRVLPRHARALVDEAMADTRAVLVNGARQSGKSTLVRLVGAAVDAEWYTFDDSGIREAASEDPSEFVAGPKPMIIDEIQRLPELLLSIKARVDERPVPGQFLLTGSARVPGLRTLPDALPGRMETIELWPCAQVRSTADLIVSSTRSSPMARTCGMRRVSCVPTTPIVWCLVPQTQHQSDRRPEGRRGRLRDRGEPDPHRSTRPRAGQFSPGADHRGEPAGCRGCDVDCRP